MIVNQWVPAAHRGDAVGDNARMLREMFRGWGHQSDIYALTIDEDMAGDARPWSDAASRLGDVTIYHYAVPSPMSAAFRELGGKRVLQYHNVTPAHFFAPYDLGLANMCAVGRHELATLAEATDLALGDSSYNRAELDALHFPRTDVLPIIVNTERLTAAPRRPGLERLLQDGLVNILFVGRIAPNKKIEDHIRLAECYKRYVDLYYRFIFVGRRDAVPGYYPAVRALVDRFGIAADRIWFVGNVPEPELAAYYRNAHAYVSLSEHEGFCVPIVEAMAMDVPVLAYGAGAVPETMGGAGMTFTPKDLEFAAELLGALVYDQPLRERLITGQRERAQAFTRARLEPRVRSMLALVA